jgi:hypothetical protein
MIDVDEVGLEDFTGSAQAEHGGAASSGSMACRLALCHLSRGPHLVIVAVAVPQVR